MTRTVYVAGASDDLVEVSGDVSLEGSHLSASPASVTVNGVRLLEVVYAAGGLWRVTVVGDVPGVDVTIVPTPGEDIAREPQPPSDIVSYSDYAILTGAIHSITVPDDAWTAQD